MKVQAVYSSVLMKISCPNCGSKGTISNEKPPKKDFPVSCPKCKENFLVKIDIRKSYRKGALIPIKYTLAGSGSSTQETKNGKIADISMNGMLIEAYINEFSPEFHKEGNLFRLFFSLPPMGTPLKVSGKVVSIRRTEGSATFNIGINFVNLDHFSNREIGFFLMP